MKYYILDEKTREIKETDFDGYVKWSKDGGFKTRLIKQEYIGGVFISTIFLMFDHRHFGSGDPVLFETMIFNGEHDQYQDRYCTEKEALEGHQKAVDMVKLSVK